MLLTVLVFVYWLRLWTTSTSSPAAAAALISSGQHQQQQNRRRHYQHQQPSLTFMKTATATTAASLLRSFKRTPTSNSNSIIINNMSSSSSSSNNNMGPPSTTSSSNTSTRGAFIVFEGMDRSGKTTQIARLVERLNNTITTSTTQQQQQQQRCRQLQFPNRATSTGQLIDSYLKTQSDLDDRTIHLLFSANRWEAADSIVQTLHSGTTILCDRYAYSGVAFSSAKGGSSSNNKLSVDWCQGPDRGLPAPDCVIFLDLSPEQARERGGYVTQGCRCGVVVRIVFSVDSSRFTHRHITY